MTDDAHADAEPVKPARRRLALRRCALWAAQALVMLLLLDGFVDIVYPAARTVVHAVRTVREMPRAPVPQPPAWAAYRERVVPGLGVVPYPVASEGLNVDALGRRSTGNAPRDGTRGLLLGSSQAFGHYVADQDTAGAAIERRRTDVTLAVIAGPARSTAESIANWQRVAGKIDAPDFAILLFSNMELYRACNPQVTEPPKEPAPALVTVPKRLLRRVSAERPIPVCSTPEAREAVAERSLYELRAALAYGRAQVPNFAVVIAPLLFGNDSNSASRAKFDAGLLDSLDKTVRAFRARIAAENIPGVIDLSDAFDGRGDAYFFDAGAHFNRAGADLLAARMLERLPEGFFAGAHIPSFQLRASATEK